MHLKGCVQLLGCTSQKRSIKTFIFIYLGILALYAVVLWVCLGDMTFFASPQKQFESGVKFLRENNFTKAAELLRKAAERGHGKAQYELGVMYVHGRGVAQNYAEAAKWYTKAAEQGEAKAQFNLGVMYAKSQGVVQNHAEAAKWFTKAAEQGVKEAQYLLGEMYISGQGVKASDEKAIQWLRKAAKQGHAKAQKRLKDVGIEY